MTEHRYRVGTSEQIIEGSFNVEHVAADGNRIRPVINTPAGRVVPAPESPICDVCGPDPIAVWADGRLTSTGGRLGYEMKPAGEDIMTITGGVSYSLPVYVVLDHLHGDPDAAPG